MRDYSDLKILKKGQSGTGLLIEHDAGYISPDEPRNLPFINEINKLTTNKIVIAEPLIVYVILQKYGVLNRNGRVYPKEVLIKQNEIYQNAIRERSALGECVPSGTQIFTTNGWVNIENVSVGDEIFTMNVENDRLEKQIVSNTIKKKYSDKMVHISNNSKLDMMITKKHKVVLWDRNDTPYVLTGEELYDKILNKDSKVSHSYIKNSALWVGENPEYFELPNSNIKIKSSDWASFLGIFIAEGHTSGSNGGKNKKIVCITQKKLKTKNKLIELLEKLPFKYSISNNRQFKIYDEALWVHLKDLGNSSQKHIPTYAKNWSVDLLEKLFEWMLIGDGKNRSYRGKLLREYYTISERLGDDVFEVLLKLGNGGSYSTRIQKDRYITDKKIINKEVEYEGELQLIKEVVKIKRLIKSKNSKPLITIHENTTKGIYLDNRFTKVELVDFDDYVYCVTVPNSTWLMRYNGKISWTHNCDHPETTVIATDRVSHNILETWWEGQTLMGKMEIIMSPGFINYGIISCKGDDVANMLRNRIKIGVSSRGVGSLKEGRNGEQIVQDDFEIICWDVVTAPSTPNAWIFKDVQDAKPYIEGIERKQGLVEESLKNKLDKFLL